MRRNSMHMDSWMARRAAGWVWVLLFRTLLDATTWQDHFFFTRSTESLLAQTYCNHLKYRSIAGSNLLYPTTTSFDTFKTKSWTPIPTFCSLRLHSIYLIIVWKTSVWGEIESMNCTFVHFSCLTSGSMACWQLVLARWDYSVHTCPMEPVNRVH